MRDKSAEGMVIRSIAPFGLFMLLSRFKVETIPVFGAT